MLCRLALGNVRKSVRDYTVYFVTLALGVAMFYAFNTIAGQASFLSEDSREIVQSLDLIMRVVTVFLALVLGFLMVYANNYLVKRRKKELGLYQLMGMTRGQVSLVLLLETLLASVASFAVGLAVGVLLSQLLVFVTAALFNDAVANFVFRFSPEAALFTLSCFALVFLVMLVFNLWTLRKVKLIDLMGASRMNERSRVRSLPATLVLTLVGVALIIWAYLRLIHDGLPVDSSEQYQTFLITTVIVIAGTLVFFYALSGLLLHLALSLRGSYYRGLNMFTARQLSSKVNTVSISMGVISLLLFLAITSVSAGLGISAGLSDAVARQAPYDASLLVIEDGRGAGDAHGLEHVDAYLADHGVDLSRFADRVMRISEYRATASGQQVTLADLVTANGAAAPSGIPDKQLDAVLTLITQTDYNKMRLEVGLPSIDLGASGYLIACNSGKTFSDFYDALLSSGAILTVDGHALAPAVSQADTSQSATLSDSYYSQGVVVMPDVLLKDGLLYKVNLNLHYSQPAKQADAALDAAVASLPTEGLYASYYTRTAMQTASRGMSAVVSYLAIYIGFVLVVACAAILAIQQLTNASDAAPSYQLLAEIGCPQRLSMHSLGVQTAVFFLLPLAVAVAHSVVALGQVSKVIDLVGASSWMGPIIFSGVGFVVVYGTYFMATYLVSRGVVSHRIAGARS